VKPTEYLGAPPHLKTTNASVPSAQERCDAIQAEFRAKEPEQRKPLRRDPPPLAPALVPTGDVLQLRLAEEIEYTRRLLDQMGDALSADTLVVGRHVASLQAIDVVGQLLGHIASVVRSSDPKGAVDRIGMDDLKGRLQRTKID
jgi:hypothetical protein